jgi:signal transduction histidine kinase
MLAALFLLTQFGLANIAWAQTDSKQVLVLYSTRRDSQFAVTGEAELPRALDAGPSRNVDYYSEFIDLTRFPDRAYRDAFRDFLRLKYRGVSFDVVIAMQDAATGFVNDYADALFPGTPIVFLANRPDIPRRRNSTGLVHQRDFASTVTLIRQLQPDVQRVFVVTGASRADKNFEEMVRSQVEPSPAGLTFTYLSGLTTKELHERVSTLPPRSAVYFVLVTQDGEGIRSHPLEYVDRVAEKANAPMYSWVDSALGHGIVGGSLYRQTGTSEAVARLALRVLRGEAADSIPVSRLELNSNVVDWRQLRRWRIDQARVPAGTRIISREPTLWDRYWHYILVAAAVLITQTALIAALLVNRKRRRAAEKELRASQGELLRAYERNRDLGSRLLKAQESERSRIAGELHDDICQRMLLLTIELEAVRSVHRGEPQAIEALIMAQDIARSLHELSQRLHPTRLKMIGLTAALDRLCVELSRAGIAITYTHDQVPATLAPELTLCLFRVVQEALQNAIKYSTADTIIVHLTGDEAVTLTVTDDGVGFNVDDAWGKGVGLVSMVERMDAIGGILSVKSTPGAGTRVTAIIPAEVVRHYLVDTAAVTVTA